MIIPSFMELPAAADDLVELLEEEFIPLPAGATLVGLPFTRPMGMDPTSGKMSLIPGAYQAVGALLPQGFTRYYVPGYSKTDKTRSSRCSAIRLLSGRMMVSM